jgi:hypothetical protein
MVEALPIIARSWGGRDIRQIVQTRFEGRVACTFVGEFLRQTFLGRYGENCHPARFYLGMYLSG